MNNNFEQFKDTLRSIRMTDNETHTVRARVLQFIESHTGETPSVESPYVRHSFILKPLQMVALALVLVLSGGSGLVYASQQSLPGEALYGFKINIAEEVVALTKRSDQAKAQYAIDLAAKRLDETTKLALAGELNDENKQIISTQLKSHTAEARKYTKTATSNLQTELALTTKIETSLSPRTEILREIRDDQSIHGELGTILTLTETNIELAKSDKALVTSELSRTATETTTEDVVIAKLAEVSQQLETINNKIPADVTTINVSDTTESTVAQVSLVTKETVSLIDEKANVEMSLLAAQEKIDAGKYTEALILLQEAQAHAETVLTFIDLKASLSIPEKEIIVEPVLEESTSIKAGDDVSLETEIPNLL